MNESDLIVEALKPFRSRAVIRGNDFRSKMDFALSRWSKCAIDCRNSKDQSEYIKNFGNSHQNLVDTIESWGFENLTDEQINYRLTFVRDSYLAALRAFIKNVKLNKGLMDAIYYLVAEIEVILL